MINSSLSQTCQFTGRIAIMGILHRGMIQHTRIGEGDAKSLFRSILATQNKPCDVALGAALDLFMLTLKIHGQTDLELEIEHQLS